MGRYASRGVVESLDYKDLKPVGPRWSAVWWWKTDVEVMVVGSMVVGVGVCDQFSMWGRRWCGGKSPKMEDEVWEKGFQMREGCDLLSKWGGVWIRQVS